MTKQVIWKFKLPELNSIAGDCFRFALTMPTGARILHLGIQDGQPVIWAEVFPDDPKVERQFYSVGTGHGVVPDDAEYVGSSTQPMGYVWHVYADDV